MLPLENVAVAILTPKDELIAARMTNSSGMLDQAVAIEVPPRSAGQTPGTGVVPFARVTVRARKEGYEQIEAEDVQVFPDTVTTQDLELIPLAEFPEPWNRWELFRTPPQNL